jgi:uncharacterized protein YdiU (UPF0061 family)
MFCTALRPLLENEAGAMQELDDIQTGFANVMREELEKMFAAKLGLASFNAELFSELITLMLQTQVDYTIFFRELSSIPEDIGPLKKSFYSNTNEEMDTRWTEWLTKWQSLVTHTSEQMNMVNPKYTLREWLLAPAYQQAAKGDYALIRELQEVMNQPYAEQSREVEKKYYRLRPTEVNELGGLSHMSCSS